MTTPDPTDPTSPLPDRIDDARRRALNETLTLAVGQGRIDLSEFSELSDAVWGVTDPRQFGRLEELISGKTAPTSFADLEKLAEKAAPPAQPVQPAQPETPAAPKKPRGKVNSFAAAISDLEEHDRTPQVHPRAGAASAPGVPSQTLWFGDLDRKGDMQLAEQQSYRLVFGDLKLDLREATLTAPVTYLQVNSVFGDVKLTVPPGVRVENRMSLILGDERADQGPRTGPGAPTVIVTGRAVFGDLRVHVAEPGEKPKNFWNWLTGE